MSPFITVLSILLAAIVLAEIALRALAPRVAKPRDWHTWQAQHKAAAIEQLGRNGGASVVAVGSSMMNAAVDAERLTDLLGAERPAFSAGLNGASTRTVELWTLDVILPILRPDLVVFGLHTSELNDNTYGGQLSARLLKRSYGWRRVRKGASRGARMLLWFEQHSFLCRYRRFLFEPAVARRAHPLLHHYQQFRKDPLHLFRKNRGGIDSVSRLGVPDSLKAFQSWKYSTRGDQIRKIWVEQYINDYDIGGPELAAFRRLVEGVRAAGATLLVVLMPATEHWAGLHGGGERDVERFRRVLDPFIADQDLAFVDLTPEFTSHDFFVDPVHLNAAGMEHFAEVAAGPIAHLLLARKSGHPSARTPPAGVPPGRLSAER